MLEGAVERMGSEGSPESLAGRTFPHSIGGQDHASEDATRGSISETNMEHHKPV